MKHLLFAALFLCAASAQAACEGTFLNSEHKRLLGPVESLCQYAGKVVLVVNTASQCGFTPQYEKLEKLYREYQSKGLVILGFPSDEFGGQEFSDDGEIAKFCKVNYGVTFPMYSRSSVKGDSPNALYKSLIASTGDAPSWNFYKYLIHRDGKTVESFNSLRSPDGGKLMESLQAALAAAK